MKKRIFWIFFLVISFWILKVKIFQGPVALADLFITGSTSLQDVEWKLPNTPLKRQTLLTHEVILSSPQKDAVLETYLFGELVGVRYKILELRSFFHWIGIQDPIEIEGVVSDYLSSDKKALYPSQFVSLSSPNKNLFRKGIYFLWEFFFYKGEGGLFVKRSSLKVEYFPLESTKGCHFHLLQDRSGSVSFVKFNPSIQANDLLSS
jgi:hypothetical protein